MHAGGGYKKRPIIECLFLLLFFSADAEEPVWIESSTSCMIRLQQNIRRQQFSAVTFIRIKINYTVSNMKPNILFAVADDASYFSACGHRFLNTPAFDRVAREGILFTGAWKWSQQTQNALHPGQGFWPAGTLGKTGSAVCAGTTGPKNLRCIRTCWNTPDITSDLPENPGQYAQYPGGYGWAWKHPGCGNFRQRCPLSPG